LNIENYNYNPHPAEGYLVFLGRFDDIKGAHTAIDVAKASNKQLKLAGTIGSFGKNIEYFKKVIQPQIDGKQIQYVGPVDDELVAGVEDSVENLREDERVDDVPAQLDDLAVALPFTH
jgi:hypothetical protein